MVLDDSRGLARAVREAFGEQALVQRCTWHKRENVVAYLPKPLQPFWRAKLQRAYRLPTYAAAHAELQRLRQDLRRRNEDAARRAYRQAGSLAEGLEETLGLESVLALVEQRVGKVDRWTTSDQQRWLATALLEIEPRLRRLRGYRALPRLPSALKTAVVQGKEVRVA